MPILRSVAALSATDVWAVGNSSSDQSATPVVAHWDGHALRLMRPVSGLGSLTGIAAVDHRDIWAVGYRGASTTATRPLVLHWDGARWRSVAVPTRVGSLSAVRAFSASSVWAVGGSGTGAAGVRAIVLAWNGSNWRLSFLGSRESSLRALDGSSPRDVWAVGGARLDAPQMASQEPLVIHWDGQGWRESFGQRSGSFVPNVDPYVIDFDAVTVRARDDVWSLASDFVGGEYVLHWTGRKQHVSYYDDSGENFGDVAAPSSNEIWVVGGSDPVQRPVVGHWTGTSFKVEKTSLEQLVNTSLNAASTRSATDIWAVGDRLIARYSC